MPNLFYMAVQFLHLFSLVVWIGGTTIIAFFVLPAMAKSSFMQHTVSTVESILARFEKVVFCCIATVILTGIVKFIHWENPNPWFLGRYISILIMAGISLYYSFFISPERILLIKKEPFSDQHNDNHAIYEKSITCMTMTASFGVLTIFLT